MRRYAALTMARDEDLHLRLWHRYYGGQFGAENLFIIDHNSQTHPPKDVLGVDCNVIRLPFDNPIQDPNGDLRKYDEIRFAFISAQISALLRYYDCVVFNDTDELMIVDGPLGLREYLDSLPEIAVRCGIGLEVKHHMATEGAYDFEASLFAQRRYFKYYLNFSKPWIISKPVQITGHGAFSPFHVDPNLLLVHLRWFDYDSTLVRHGRRLDAYAAGRGGLRSRWGQSTDELDENFRGTFRRKIEFTRMGQMPHRAVMEDFLPGYTEQEFSSQNYERKYGKRKELLEVERFIDEKQRLKFQSRIFKFPEGFKGKFI
jgi:hypothetical protein